ncbi:hypothetical protein L1987_12921 [Smallanthus sonchifolius]|uniref:Uncharacterized protein n=1 Tax=Smallanthus sonchifolius TaxID=185202 RepID=A0ACB9JF27_9ASTR|nr:hypothetical protein L1987_12921 [Smallanthus sonchifolius]
MVLSELLLQPSWPTHSHCLSNHDQYNLKMKVYVTTTPENSSVSLVNFPVLCNDHDHVGMHNSSLVNMDGFDDVCRWLCDDDLYEQDESMEFDSQTGIKNLLMAYAEAIEMEQEELAKVIVKCVNEKASPNGSPLERVAFNLFQPEEDQEKAYLFQESLRNFNPAFRAFYEIFPCMRFAHLTAGSAIIEAVPTHVDLVHIIDFDICEGIQWPPVIEAIARIKKSLIITSIKLDQDQDSRFDQTRWHLCNFARSLGLDLKVQEMGMSQMMKKMDERKLESEFTLFNCMTGLLHTRRTRKTTQVMNFLKIARGILATNQGIITIGDDLEVERMRNYSEFSSFFNKNLAYYKALYESMEWGFPSYINEARIAMETLFLAPFVSSKSWFEKWEERREHAIFYMNMKKGFGLKGVRMSMESWNEAMEMVKEGETPYRIRTGENGNEMVLEWKGTPLVRVCAWKVMT